MAWRISREWEYSSIVNIIWSSEERWWSAGEPAPWRRSQRTKYTLVLLFVWPFVKGREGGHSGLAGRPEKGWWLVVYEHGIQCSCQCECLKENDRELACVWERERGQCCQVGRSIDRRLSAASVLAGRMTLTEEVEPREDTHDNQHPHHILSAPVALRVLSLLFSLIQLNLIFSYSI